MMSAVTDEQDALTGLRVAVLGPGGVGGLLAALLARAGAAVTCLASAGTADRLRTAGVRVESGHFGDFTTPVDAAERLTSPVDVVLVCVKATHLDDALERVPAGVLGDALVVPLLNGVEHVGLLRRRYPEAGVVPATIRVESTRTEPGVVRHGSPFVTVDLVAVGGPGQRVRRLADALQQAGVTTRVGDDEQAALWSKLNFLAPLALLTTAAQATAGEVRESRREDLVAIVGEVAAVARAEGAPADEEQVVDFFDGVPAGMRSSMQRDAAAGRPIELDAIGGAVVRAATRHGVAVPVTARYVDELRERHPGS
jgi:2-dehydropantoate 2-reductase